MKFVAREQRRQSLYNGIVLDPPSFGRGSQGQVWKIEEGIRSLLESCRAILDTKNPYFILLSCHSQGFSPITLGRCLAEVFPGDELFLEQGEMVVPEYDSNRLLPAGMFARIFKKM
jgi:23S rRNA (cytosine1962-C5)-methyltransferase